MSCGEGTGRKRSREEPVFQAPISGPKHPKRYGDCDVKAVRVEEVVVDTKRASVDYHQTVLELLPEMLNGWDFPVEFPCFRIVDEQLFLGWFPFVEDDFVGLWSQQNEVIWEDDIWELKGINEIPNQ